jgi:hypothetical protein
VANLLKSTTKSIGDESLQHLSTQASISPYEIISYIERKEREDLRKMLYKLIFKKLD